LRKAQRRERRRDRVLNAITFFDLRAEERRDFRRTVRRFAVVF
jgi:hypothetical protein